MREEGWRWVGASQWTKPAEQNAFFKLGIPTFPGLIVQTRVLNLVDDFDVLHYGRVFPIET